MTQEFLDFVKRQNLDQESEQLLISNTQKILQRTELLTDQDSANCQIVVGEVQSGKTMSFTALTALAHDNGFSIVIVIAGVTKTLHGQTAERLFRDLKCEGKGGIPQWTLIRKPTPAKRNENLEILNESLSFWKDPFAPQEFKQTVIITCLKNSKGLLEVRNLLAKYGEKHDLRNMKVLIIDDEGDEAGLNLEHANNNESSVYSAIRQLRETFNKHSYVMYTATPQGPLLISIQDSLSPKYVTLLSSGPDYLGGSDLFSEGNTFVRRIPQTDAQFVFNSDHSATVPKSLKFALAYFLLALRISQIKGYPKPLSMLIHPSVKVDLHETYKVWVSKVLNAWSTTLSDDSEELYQIEKHNFFQPALEELTTTAQLPRDFNLDNVLKDMKYWIGSIGIRIANKDYSDIDTKLWMTKPGWILIGGNKLSRGFTIHNLAVSYMPRSTGVGNVDVIQQRGRFFGYKRKYNELLRGWFFQDQIAAFTDYIEHEKSMRDALREIDETNSLLKDWRRRFLLDTLYRPVRARVISLNIAHLRLTNFKQQMLFDRSVQGKHDEMLSEALRLANNLTPMPNDFRSSRKNYYCEVSLDKLLELLVEWPASMDNRRELDDLVWAVKIQQDSGKINKAVLVFMDWEPSLQRPTTRNRSILRDKPVAGLAIEDHNINDLWQGTDVGKGVKYPGDSAMCFEDALTVQIHSVKPQFPRKDFLPVTALAVITPANLTGVIVEV